MNAGKQHKETLNANKREGHKMNYADKKDLIGDLRKELDNLKAEFGKIKPHTDWVKIQIEPLLTEGVEPLLKLLDREVHIKEELVDSFIEYVRKHIDGLKLVFEAEKKSYFDRKTTG